MSELDYAGHIETLEAFLQAHADLRDVTVTTALDPPTADACPHVMLYLDRADYETLTFGTMSTALGNDFARLVIVAAATAFSAAAESASKDSARQRDRLTSRLIPVVQQLPTLNDRVKYIIRKSVDFLYRPEDAGIFATAVIRFEVGAFA